MTDKGKCKAMFDDKRNKDDRIKEMHRNKTPRLLKTIIKTIQVVFSLSLFLN